MFDIRYRTRNELEQELRVARAYLRATQWLERRFPRISKLVNWLVRVSFWDLHKGVTETFFALAALLIFAAVAVGVDGWTTGNELRWMINGTVLLVAAVFQIRNRGKTLLRLYLIYKRDEGSQVESTPMPFDIRESYIDRLLSRLNEKFPGTVVFGRYFAPRGRDAETVHFEQGKSRNWENRAKMRIRSLCFAWKDGNKGFRIEYRRTPAQIFADRFIETTGFDEVSHQRLRQVFLEEEWACRPRFEWVTKIGLYWIFLVAGVLVVFFLLGPGVWYLSFGQALSMDALPFIVRAFIIELAIMLTLGVILMRFRGHYFPSGILRIDEEGIEQERKDKARGRLLKGAFVGLASVVLGLLAEPIVALCTESRVGGFSSPESIRWNFSETAVCRYIVPRIQE